MSWDSPQAIFLLGILLAFIGAKRGMKWLLTVGVVLMLCILLSFNEGLDDGMISFAGDFLTAAVELFKGIDITF